MNLYEATADEKWLLLAKKLNAYSLQHFYDTKSKMFFYTNADKNDLLTRPMETSDNVIPSSNAVMADNLFCLGHYFENRDWVEKNSQMIHNILPKVDSYPPGYYEWMNDLLDHLGKFYEVAIVGKDARKKSMELFGYYLPNKVVAPSEKSSDLPLLKDRFVEGKTLIYLCVDNACQLPVEEVKQVVLEMGK